MPTVYYGDKTNASLELESSDDLIVVRTRSGKSVFVDLDANAKDHAKADDKADFVAAAAALRAAQLVVAYPDAGVEVFRVAADSAVPVASLRATLKKLPDVRFAGKVLVEADGDDPVLYTDNLFIKFNDACDEKHCRELMHSFGMKIKSEVTYATNAFIVMAKEGSGITVFDLAQKALKHKEVEFCNPELIQECSGRGIFAQQWHLRKTCINGVDIEAHANVEAAHLVTRGAGITIAIIDDGVDIDHIEFSGATKIKAPRDVSRKTNDPRPKDEYGKGKDNGENHGTGCAGVACAMGIDGASGVAPDAHLMPIRKAGCVGSLNEAEAFKWAADQGADVISCSWGPQDGEWWNPDDERHSRISRMPTSTRLAIEYAVTKGRGGKGCVILFASGNGNESVDNDGYASYPKVIAVAACNDRGKRSVYSDFGDAVWCAFPSNDRGNTVLGNPEPLTPGIWTTDRLGEAGYNVGNAGSAKAGDAKGDYTHKFSGTSAACPGAAGVAALVLAANPNLKWHEVKDILARSCDKIDKEGGSYDAKGHSPKYGYGRVNARAAVDLAMGLCPAGQVNPMSQAGQANPTNPTNPTNQAGQTNQTGQTSTATAPLMEMPPQVLTAAGLAQLKPMVMPPIVVPQVNAPPLPPAPPSAVEAAALAAAPAATTAPRPVSPGPAMPPTRTSIIVKRKPDAPTPAPLIITHVAQVTDTKPISSIKINVDIKNAPIAELVLTLAAPDGMGVKPVILQQRTGTGSDLKKVFDAANTPQLSAFAAKNCAGFWTLEVQGAKVGEGGTELAFSVA